ncbi:hypothetical protein R1sor_000616 [Riccia sorocarpa]|uniref:BTB domain-containing protein n=1 Tax=Riccia sorocarpa TaxID=122646 RepID=A0ABD3GZM3_9MARC
MNKRKVVGVHRLPRVRVLSETPCLSADLLFLRKYEVSPLCKDFRGDIKFVGSNGEEVYAHKFILVERSMVFRRMFDVDMGKESGIVECPDVGAPVLRSMVNFCYTADIEFTDEAPAEEMLKIAHTYQIDYLKVVCEDELVEDIDKESFCRLLLLARKYDAKLLSEELEDYFRESFDDVYPVFAKRLCRDDL